MQMRFTFAEQVRKPNYRKSDPETSRLAGEEIEKTGQAETQRQKCLWAVENWPGMTAAEVAVKTGLERHVPPRRLPELRHRGIVVNGEIRICTVQNRPSITWWRKK